MLTPYTDQARRGGGFPWRLAATTLSESRVKWGLIAALAVIDFIGLRAAGITVAFPLHIILLLSILPSVAFVYTYVRPNERIAEFATTFGQMFCFGLAALIATYLMAAADFPLIDGYLAAADRWLGFDWLALFRWLEDKPALKVIAQAAYHSYVPQILFLMVFFNLTGRLDRGREFITLFMASTLIIVPWSMIFPAASAWVYFDVVDWVQAYHLSAFNAVRAGTLHEITLGALTGLVTFPSLHTTHALTFIYITRGIRYLSPIWIGLNVVMLTAVPTIGGHYFVDVLAGAMLFPLAVLVVRRQKAAAAMPELPLVVPGSDVRTSKVEPSVVPDAAY